MRLIGILVALALAFIVLWSAAYVVFETEQAIILQFGKPVGDPINKAGLHFKLPFIQEVLRLDKRYLEWDGQPNELPTKDKRFIWVDTYARWQITEPLKFFERLRDESGARRRLDDIINGETRNAIANYDLAEAVRSDKERQTSAASTEEEAGTLQPIAVGREEIRRRILDSVQTLTGDLGIEILDVQFKRINYVEEVREKVEDRMMAERERIASRFRSEGDGEASRIRGEKERVVKEVISEARRKAEEIRGAADAEATEIYAGAYNQSRDSRDFYEFLKSLETYRSTFDDETMLILSTDGDFYRFLKQSQ